LPIAVALRAPSPRLAGYQAPKKHVVDAPKKICFDRAAVENDDEEAVAIQPMVAR
jgi:hypothetical protein